MGQVARAVVSLNLGDFVRYAVCISFNVCIFKTFNKEKITSHWTIICYL